MQQQPYGVSNMLCRVNKSYHCAIIAFLNVFVQLPGFHILAYHFHDLDPCHSTEVSAFVWMIGDSVDPKTGHKCFMKTGGHVVGSPTKSIVSYYSWVYVF